MTARGSTHCLWPQRVPAGERPPPGPSHLAENLSLPVVTLEGKESLPGRPRCSFITLFALRSLSSLGWCWVYGQEHLLYKEAHSLGWAAGEHTPSKARPRGGWRRGPGGRTVGRNRLLPILQHSPPLPPGNPSVCHGHGSSRQSLCVGHCAAGGQDRVASCIFTATLTPMCTLTLIIGKLRQ